MDLLQLIIDNLPVIITAGLTILSIVLGKKYRDFKRSFIIIVEFLDLIIQSIDDDEITLDEIKLIIAKIKELKQT